MDLTKKNIENSDEYFWKQLLFDDQIELKILDGPNYHVRRY